ncbi:MAG: hypothetical protein ABI614_09235, partial [Planctomycetota bacterium]
TRDKPLYVARHDDLPIHLIAVDAQGGLVTAAWNGRIRNFDAEGSLVDALSLVVPALPTHLLPLADGRLIVADQQRRVHCYDHQGARQWTWTEGEEIRRIWSHDEPQRQVLIVQTGPNSLTRVVDGQTAEVAIFPQPICDLSRRGVGGDEWTIVACQGGGLKWLSSGSLAVVQELQLDFSVKRIQAIEDLQNRSRLAAVGLTDDGCVFSAAERDVTLYRQPRGIRRMLGDRSGRFLYLLFEDRIEAHRNPLQASVELHAEIVQPVAGMLTVGRFKKIDIQLRNTGSIAIHRLNAWLFSPDIIEKAEMIDDLAHPVPPERTVAISFSVRAKQAGYVTLTLILELADEGGPPMSKKELTFHLESQDATSVGHP